MKNKEAGLKICFWIDVCKTDAILQICKIFRHKLCNLKRLCIFSHWVLSAQFIADFLYFGLNLPLIVVKFLSNFGAKGFNTKIIGYYFRTFKCKFLGVQSLNAMQILSKSLSCNSNSILIAKQICYDFNEQKQHFLT